MNDCVENPNLRTLQRSTAMYQPMFECEKLAIDFVRIKLNNTLLMFKYNSSLFRDVYTSSLFLVVGHFVTDILSEQSLMELVRVKCMQPAEQLR